MKYGNHAVQGTEEWHAQRLGKFTASRFGDVITPAPRIQYVAEVIGEMLTGKPSTSFSSKYTEWGHTHEASARQAFQLASGIACQSVGFVHHPDYPLVGGSPDSVMEHINSTLELKCPFTPKNHIRVLLEPSVPKKEGYDWQCQGHMFNTGAESCYFASYHPDFEPRYQLVWFKVEKDEKMQAKLRSGIEDALERLDRTMEKLRSRNEQ